jgi:hypothetical protein
MAQSYDKNSITLPGAAAIAIQIVSLEPLAERDFASLPLRF